MDVPSALRLRLRSWISARWSTTVGKPLIDSRLAYQAENVGEC
jgi:hypothetical protein